MEGLGVQEGDPQAGGGWSLGPPLLIGDRVFYTGEAGRSRVTGDNLAFMPGIVRWMGRIQECFGDQMIAGVALVRQSVPHVLK